MITDTSLPTYINDLINIRKSKKIKQYQLAKMVGCSRTHMNNIERGFYRPNGQFLEECADALGCVIRILPTE